MVIQWNPSNQDPLKYGTSVKRTVVAGPNCILFNL